MFRALAPVSNERGATLIFTGLLLVGLFTLFVLAVDVGLWLNTRSEAQRVADGSALAGAGVFGDGSTASSLSTAARDTSRRFAGLNYVGHTAVNTGENGDVDVTVIPDSQKVRVTVRGRTAPLFANLLGYSVLPVAGRAAARMQGAGAAQCVKPFALPDLWEERTGEDADANRIVNGKEIWIYNAGVDRYGRWEMPDNGGQTGYGSTFRDGKSAKDVPAYERDRGRPFKMEVGSPQQGIRTATFFPFVMEHDPNMKAACGVGGGGDPGASQYSANICECNNVPVKLGVDYPIKNGDMVGPIKAGIKDLIKLDPTAYWNESTRSVVSPFGSNSPRLIKLALFNPAEMAAGSGAYVRFNNFALFFVEEHSGNFLVGRFVGAAQGSAPGNGSLVRILQLVE